MSKTIPTAIHFRASKTCLTSVQQESCSSQIHPKKQVVSYHPGHQLCGPWTRYCCLLPCVYDEQASHLSLPRHLFIIHPAHWYIQWGFGSCAQWGTEHFNIKYRPGKVNVHTDTVSRSPGLQWNSKTTWRQDWDNAQMHYNVSWATTLQIITGAESPLPVGMPMFTPEDIRATQKGDLSISKLKESGWTTGAKDLVPTQPGTRRLIHKWNFSN